MRILVVDDETIVLDGLRRRLLEMDLPEIGEVMTASCVDDALAILRKKPVQLLITDIELGRKNGFELIENAQKMQPDVTCVIVTAYADFNYAQQAIRLGVVDFVLKPCTEMKMCQAVMRAIEKNRRQTPSQEALDAMRKTDPVLWACEYVRTTPIDRIDMATVANELDMSYSYFSRLFKQKMGVLFSDFVTELKMKQALNLLKEGHAVREIAHQLGYLNHANFSRAFKNYYHVNPSDYAAGLPKEQADGGNPTDT